MNSFQHGGDCRAFNSKGLENERCYGVHNPIVAVRCVNGSDGGRSSCLAGKIIKQRFAKPPSSAVRFCSLKISSGISLYRRALSIIRRPYFSLFVALKSASIRRIARSFETSLTPNIFSSITDRPFDHRSNAMPFFRASETRNAWNWEI